MADTRTDPRFAYRKDGQLKHSQACGMAFGRLDPEHCARCAERAAEREQGTPARTHDGFDRMRQAQRDDARRAEEIRDHFASAKHTSGGCGVCCTFGDW